MGGVPGQRALRTVDVARESGYSVQQVRDLERLGVLPPAVRAANGYRSYTPLHVLALRAYRGLAAATGPVAARRLLAELRAGTLAEAAAAVGAVHVRLARERDEALRAQQALRAIAAESGTGPTGPVGSTGPTEPDSDTMTITQLAGALGVRTSTLRFWEQEGLLAPERVTSQRARSYGPAAVGTARVVVALRSAGYGIPAVRQTLASLQQGDGYGQQGDGCGEDGYGESARILRERLDRIAARTMALLRAGSDLAAVVERR